MKSDLLRRNFALLVSDLAHRRTAWEALPMHLEISTNTTCNLRCVMCRPPDREEPVSPVRLDLLKVREVIEALGPALAMLTPSSGSEPFLGDLLPIAEMCREREVLLTVITNGTLLTPPRYRAIHETLLYLQVSFDSHQSELYERIRVGADYRTVLDNLRSVIPMAAGDGIETCVSAVLHRETVPRLPEYVDFVSDLGFGRIELQRLIHRFDLGAIDAFGNLPPRLLERRLREAVRRAKARRVDLHLNMEPRIHYLFSKRRQGKVSDRGMSEYLYYLMRRFPDFCFQAAHYLRVTPDGSVYPCCNHHDSLLMGNIHQDSVRAIWNGEPYQQLREEFYSGNLRRHCAECLLRAGFRSISFRPRSPKWALRRGMTYLRTARMVRRFA